MTYIKRLELHGFKSFANKLSVDLCEGFSSFVGSNGSGKSNVIDALCFVLGKTSKKSMRAEMLTDLIFRGKDGRTAKFAEVNLVFHNDGVFPYEGEEFVISRRVAPNGTSIFKINGKAVKRQEILNALTSAGINPNGFNIILQGEIQKFVNLSPDEMREVIEDISGISVYEEKKKKSLRELEKVDGKLEEANTRLAERERYLKEIINDKKQAEKYVKLQEELKDKKAALLFKKINEQEQKVTDFDEKISTNESRLQEMQDSIKRYEDEITSFNEELARVRGELEKKGSAEQQALSRKIEKIKSRKMELEGIINNHEHEIERIKQRKEDVKSEIKTVELSIKESRVSLASIEKELEKLNLMIDKKKKASGAGMEEEILRRKEELLKIEEELSILNNDLVKAESMMEKKKELKTLERKKESLLSGLKGISTALFDKEKKKESLTLKKKEVSDYLNKLNTRKMTLESRKNAFIDYASLGVRSVLKLGMAGVHGTIASLGLTEKKYATALSVAAGGRINAIVTDDDIVAQKAISYLRSKELGTASFIPLNKVNPFMLRNYPRAEGVIGPAINLIKFDQKYRKAFELVLGNTLVVRDIDAARRVGFGNARMVTLQGDLIEKSGIMTGGYRGKKSAFLDKDVDKELSEIEIKLRTYKRYSNELSSQLGLLSEEIMSMREDKARAESILEELSRSIDDMKSQIIGSSSVDELREKIKKLIKRKQELKNKNESKVSSNILKIAREELKVLQEKHNNLLVEKNTLKAKLERVLLSEKEKLSNIINDLSKELAKFKKELSNARSDLLSTNAELREASKEEAKFYKDLKVLYDKRDRISKKIERNRKAISDLEKGIFSIKEKIQALNLKRASVVAKLEGLKVAFEEFKDWEPHLPRKPVSELQNEINKLEVMVRNFGPVNMKSIETYKEVEKEFNEIKSRVDELSGEKEEVLKVIENIEGRKKEAFNKTFKFINENFGRIFATLSPGGIARLVLEDKDNPFNGGIMMIVRPKGKRLLTLKSLSGGEKTIAALAFIFAIQEYSPTPFYVMDEVDAALDKVNTEKLAEMIKEHSKKAQFIAISHNDELISAADYIYGVSMDKKGVSSIVSIKLPD